MNFLVAGGTGLVGSTLTADLVGAGHGVTILSRRGGPRPETGLSHLRWPAGTNADLVKAIEGSDCVVNLAGEPIAGGRWTAFRKEEILQSRVRATRALVGALERARKRPACFVNASAVGFYGDRGGEEMTEKSHAGIGFLADTCRRWEEEAQKAGKTGVRLVILRIGIVLAPAGGALAKMVPPFRFFLGGPLGGGRQWMSWIHIKDLIRLMRWAAGEKTAEGVYNAVSPAPARMSTFARELGAALKRPSFLPVPGFALRALLGETAEMLLTGQKVLPKRALEAGFKFEFDALPAAFRDLFPGEKAQ